MKSFYNGLGSILETSRKEILKEWVIEQAGAISSRRSLMSEKELADHSLEFLTLLTEAIKNASNSSIDEVEWIKTRNFIEQISRSRSIQGFSPSETASFIFSIRAPLNKYLVEGTTLEKNLLLKEVTQANLLIDKLGLLSTEAYQKSRDQIILKQQQEMLELSTPVITLWDGILALPMIGTLDSSRTQVVMETLLQKIVDTEASIAILDITGVPTVDTLVAQYILKTVTAAKLMGAECIISGIRPQIASTIVHLGVDLGNIVTKASLRDAFVYALNKMGRNVGALAKKN